MARKKSEVRGQKLEEIAAPKIWTVSELTREIRFTLEKTFGSIWVEGEISNLRRPDSGHVYFTIKDAGAQLAAVLFRDNARDLGFEISDGQQVVALGEISVYEPRGQYQIICRRLLPKGLGALQAQFEALKRKLDAEGLFAATRKKPIPPFPEHIGIVTSPTGAAIRDILNIINRRYPNIHIVIYPVRVQGEGAAEEISEAIDQLNALSSSEVLTLDVIIVTRGGGSLEDLWAFNEEIVARAIASSKIPIISAVGHEIDFTIADFVADLRAPTPSAAAELVVKQRLELIETIGQLQNRLARGLRHELTELRHRVEQATVSYAFRQPENLITQYRQRVDHTTDQMRQRTEHLLAITRELVKSLNGRIQKQNPDAVIAEKLVRVSELKARTDRLAHTALVSQFDHRDQLAKRLDALSHKSTLRRGYSITRLTDGRIVKTVKTVKSGDHLRTAVSDGEFGSVVEK